jgi:hypothetical protein
MTKETKKDPFEIVYNYQGICKLKQNYPAQSENTSDFFNLRNLRKFFNK